MDRMEAEAEIRQTLMYQQAARREALMDEQAARMETQAGKRDVLMDEQLQKVKKESQLLDLRISQMMELKNCSGSSSAGQKMPGEMYKLHLQELCQKKSWSNPEYKSLKEGPSHNPSFKSSVTVNCVTFQSPVYCKHIKQSQSEAAKIAYLHFTTSAPTLSPATTCNLSGTNTTGIKLGPVNKPAASDHNVHENLDTDTRLEVKHMFKTQLQTYAQKRNLDLPEYSSKREGPPHLSRFTCSVSVAENTYQCHQSFPTLKEAEHAAAKLALASLASSGLEVHDDNTLIYKNLLQELAQKQGFDLPTYSTKRGGLPHTPFFLSTVEVKGETFQGEEAKARKRAEMDAAKGAYISIKQREISKSQKFIPADCQCMKACSSFKSTSNVDSQENIRHKPIACTGLVPDKQIKHESAEDKKVSCAQVSIPKRDDGSVPRSRFQRKRETTNMAPHKKVCILSPKLNVQLETTRDETAT